MPRFDGTASLVLATGILGATVMPHAIYLHSALVRRPHPGDDESTSAAARSSAQRIDVMAAMSLAGLVNAAMLLVAAALFAGSAFGGTDTLGGAHAGFGAALDGSAALLFALALLASGFASASVGTYAGQVIMQGFLRRQIPLFARRALTMLPALVDPRARRRPHRGAGGLAGRAVVRHPVRAGAAAAADPPPRTHGRAGQRTRTTAVAALVAAVIIGLNAVLLWHTFT